MSGKREVCRQQLSLKFQQKKSHEKIQNEKNATKNRKKDFQPSRKRPSLTFSGKYFKY